MYKKRYHSHRGGRSNNRKRFNKTFDPREVIGRSVETKVDDYIAKNKFSDFEIAEKLKQAIAKRAYAEPTPIQDQTIPEILKGHDVVGIANTGTGKTAAFLIPLINKVTNNDKSRVLIVAPTRELAVQIDKELKLFTNEIRVSSAICIGGVSIRPQIDRLSHHPIFLIGTPGRLIDLENQRKINFSQFDSVVLDEVDRMLDMGFIKDMRKIISKLPHKRQSLFFSATLDAKTKSIMSSFLKNPVHISVKKTDTCTNVRQGIVKFNGKDKEEVLFDLLDRQEVSKSLIFTRTKRGADTLHRNLVRVGFQSAVLHGNKSQNQRQRSLMQFRLSKVNVLIATDVASRGIDVDDISHVINYDLPESYDTYIHRIGRTGRAGKNGIALTFVT